MTMALLLAGGVVPAQSEAEIAAAISTLDEERLDRDAMVLLIEAGEPAVAPLVEALVQVQGESQRPRGARVLRVLRAMEHRAVAACAPLARTVGDLGARRSGEEWGFANDVIATLTRLVPFAPEQAAELRRTLFPPDGGRPFPFRDLERPGPRLRLAYRLLRAEQSLTGDVAAPQLDSRDLFGRELALEQRCRSDYACLPQILELLEDDDQPRQLVDDILLSPARANRMIHIAAARALARIAPGHPRAIRGLGAALLTADDPRDRAAAAASLGQHGPAAREEVGVLLLALDSDDDQVVAEAVTALGVVGVASEDVLAHLRALAEDPRVPIARRAASALHSLEGR